MNHFNVVECSSEFSIDPERLVCMTRIYARMCVCMWNRWRKWMQSIFRKNMPLAITSFFFFFFEHTHKYILNKETMLSQRLMGYGNSLENTNDAARRQDWRQKFLLLLSSLLFEKKANIRKSTLRINNQVYIHIHWFIKCQ